MLNILPKIPIENKMLVLHPQISVLGGLDPEQSEFVKSEMQRLSNMTKVNTGTAYRLPKAIFLVSSLTSNTGYIAIASPKVILYLLKS